MSIRSAALGLAMLTAMTASGLAEDQPAPSTEAVEPQWAEFQSPERGFAVTFPGAPKFATAPSTVKTRCSNTISKSALAKRRSIAWWCSSTRKAKGRAPTTTPT